MTSTPGCGLRSFRRYGRPAPGTAGVPRSSAGTAARGRSSLPCALNRSVAPWLLRFSPTPGRAASPGPLGDRWSRMNRLTASRTSVAVEVGPPGSSQVVTVKVAATTDGLAGFGTATAELAEAEAAARALGWPVRAVCEAAVAQY